MEETTLSTRIKEHSLSKRGEARAKAAEIAEHERTYPLTGVEMSDRIVNGERDKLKADHARLNKEADIAADGSLLGAYPNDMAWVMANRTIFNEAAAAHRTVNLEQ
jgi:hypothetical protein